MSHNYDQETAQAEQDLEVRAGRAADELRRLWEEETEEPPPVDQAFVAGAQWALGQRPELDVPEPNYDKD